MPADHSPTPWKFYYGFECKSGLACIEDANKKLVVDFSGDTDIVMNDANNGNIIVDSVNAHAALVAVLRAAESFRDDINERNQLVKAGPWIQFRAAIAAARGVCRD